MSDWIREAHEKAADRVREELAKPYDDGQTDSGSYFDPWELFPCFYGSYGADFDHCAIGVLEGLLDTKRAVWDLPSHMFREVLCTSDLCEYGTSPRACFPTQEFKAILPDFIERWKGYYAIHWGEPFQPTPITEGEK